MISKSSAKNQALQINPWRPDKPASKGAASYHDAVSNAQYYIDILDELIKKVYGKIKENDVVVDFGAGTGISTMRLFNYLKSMKSDIKIWLVDNSAAWLGKAYEIFSKNSYVDYFLLQKSNDRYETLAESVGEGAVNHVISANTVHLIPNLKYTFSGINLALKPGGTFAFQSGNIMRQGREDGVLLIDDTFKRVHDIAIDTIRNDKKFAKYNKDIDRRIEAESSQRKFVFPEPRPLDYYIDSLKKSGFELEASMHKLFKIPYKG